MQALSVACNKVCFTILERIAKSKCSCREIVSQNSTKEARINYEIERVKVNECNTKFEVVLKMYEIKYIDSSQCNTADMLQQIINAVLKKC